MKNTNSKDKEVADLQGQVDTLNAQKDQLTKVIAQLEKENANVRNYIKA